MTDIDFRFQPPEMPPNEVELRREVREFVADLKRQGKYHSGRSTWASFDREVSRALGRAGWIGMTWPKVYGGHERTELERYVVTEELLAFGVPMRGHWAADRQNGPLILQFGNTWQKENVLPQFASGETSCAIGLSEPDSGSDLAAMRTRAVQVDGGWSVTGRKVWTSGAHQARYMTVLLRTGDADAKRHAGVTRMLIDLTWKGITVRPIMHMAGEHDFNEVVFDDVFVPDYMVIGEPGGAWKQLVGAELSRERSAPDRWTAQINLLRLMVDKLGSDPIPSAARSVGRLVAHLWTLRSMSASIAGMLERGRDPSVESSIVKDLGTHYEQEIPHLARELVGEEERSLLSEGDPFPATLRFNLLYAPALTIRGGTSEILRNNIARGLGLR